MFSFSKVSFSQMLEIEKYVYASPINGLSYELALKKIVSGEINYTVNEHLFRPSNIYTMENFLD